MERYDIEVFSCEVYLEYKIEWIHILSLFCEIKLN